MIIVTIVFLAFLPSLQNIPRARLPDMVYGTAHRPFVYRALVPGMVRVITPVLPEDAFQDSSFVRSAFALFDWEMPYAREYMVSFALIYLGFFAFAWAVRALITSLYGTQVIYGYMVSIAAVFLLIAFWSGGYTNYIYDIATLALTTYALALLVRQRWTVYLFVFLLACINKETTILLAFIFALHYFRRMERRRFAVLFGTQIVIFAAVKGALTLAFSSTPGSIAEVHLAENLQRLALVPILPEATLMLVCLSVLILYRWREKPVFLKHALWMLPPLFILGMVSGMIDEYRIFYEVYPVVLLLVAHSVIRILRPRANAHGKQQVTELVPAN